MEELVVRIERWETVVIGAYKVRKRRNVFMYVDYVAVKEGRLIQERSLDVLLRRLEELDEV